MQKAAFNVKFGMNLKIHREALGISQSELARLCFKDRQYIHRIENGSITPTVYTMYLICKELNLEIEKLFEL